MKYVNTMMDHLEGLVARRRYIGGACRGGTAQEMMGQRKGAWVTYLRRPPVLYKDTVTGCVNDTMHAF